MSTPQNSPKQNAVLRPINPADADQLRRLHAHSLQKNAAGFIQNATFHGDIFARAEKYQNDNGAMLGLFDDNGTLLGFGGIKPTENGRAELCNLHLHPDYQGQGLGKQMALALIDEAKDLGYHTVELHVTVSQDKAIGLYKHLGFVETKRQVYDVEGQKFDTVFMEFLL
ncbi:MAG: GNAT family N-acetyltransferase [Micavibrio sp.]|nr:GNAT family N-acetyltransferase [Micavibrio sp.]